MRKVDPPDCVYGSPGEFDIAERLTLRHIHGEWSVGHEYWEPPILVLELELRPQRVADRRRLCLTFSGVSNLRFRRTWEPLMQLHVLEVLPYSDESWNGPRYWVSDIEQETLSFYCQAYTASITEASEPDE
jgi:hypothetical protein